jgi:hypothetical protein
MVRRSLRWPRAMATGEARRLIEASRRLIDVSRW